MNAEYQDLENQELNKFRKTNDFENKQNTNKLNRNENSNFQNLLIISEIKILNTGIMENESEEQTKNKKRNIDLVKNTEDLELIDLMKLNHLNIESFENFMDNINMNDIGGSIINFIENYPQVVQQILKNRHLKNYREISKVLYQYLISLKFKLTNGFKEYISVFKSDSNRIYLLINHLNMLNNFIRTR